MATFCTAASHAQNTLDIHPETTPLPATPRPDRIKKLLYDTDKLLIEAVGMRQLFNSDIKNSDTIEDHHIKIAHLNILNKITAHSQYTTIETGVDVEYGTLKIKLYDCLRSKVHDTISQHLESSALIEVTEKSPIDFVNMSLIGNEIKSGKKIFFGWILKSSPAMSSLEHPVYDITLQKCGE